MKKKFTIHLDAILVIAILFCSLITLTIFQHSQIDELTQNNQALEWKALENNFNIDTQKNHIEKLELQISNINLQ
jgi:hypothetical protein